MRPTPRPSPGVRGLLLLAALPLLAGCGQETTLEPPRPEDIAIHLHQAPGTPDHRTFEVSGLGEAHLARLRAAELSDAQWAALFAVFTEPAQSAGLPPLFGSWEVEEAALRFRPRFPLVEDLTYHARLDLARLADGASDPAAVVTASFTLPRGGTPETVVERIYPSGDRLPKNLLKLYLHFSAPMSRGEGYRHVHLFDDTGEEVVGAFLEVEEELWDPELRRFTLFLHPGRIKRGLRPHAELGPALESGRVYRLVVDAAWRDGRGHPLAAGLEKRFTVAPADRTSPDPDTWRLTAPAAGSREALVLDFGEPLDHALAQRLVAVTGAAGEAVAGTVEIADGERRWVFTPEQPWRAGGHRVVVDPRLEDLAGNNLAAVFDVDLGAAGQRHNVGERVEIGFAVE